MTKEIRAVCYARVSSKEQAEKELSIPAQLEAMRKYCKEKGWKVVHEYIDSGKSAKTADRPEFQNMIAMAKKQNKNFDAIVVHKFDRFSRNRDDHVIYKSLLKQFGIFVYSVTEQTDPETPHGFLLEGIMEVISEFYNLNLRNEVFKGMKENTRKGYWNGGSAPYGYRIQKISNSSGGAKSILVPGTDEEIAIVKRIFHNYVYDNYGYRKIASDLNIEGIPSKSGTPWAYTSIHTILHNEIYIGNTVWNIYDYSHGKKKKPEEEWIRQENTHTAIISKEDFDLVKEKSKSRIKNSNLFEATNTTFILRGLLRCPYCGSNMVGSQSGYKKGSKTVRKYYLCGNYQRRGKSACKFKSFNKEKFEGVVINALTKEFTFLTLDKILEEEIIKYSNDKHKEHGFSLNNLIQQLELLNMRVDLSKKELEFTSDKSKLKKYINELTLEIDAKSIEIDKLEKELTDSVVPSDDVDIIRNKLKNFLTQIHLQTPDIQNMLLKELVESVTINLVNNIVCIHVIINSISSNGIVLDKYLYVSL